MTDTAAENSRQSGLHVVVVGGGFGGLTLIQNLAGTGATITLVDKRNHHLFQPLLYQVATAALSPADIAQPIRGIVHSANVTIRLDEACGIDLAQRRLLLCAGDSIGYDLLVLATGVQYTYFKHPEWAAFAPSLKDIGDATAIRERLLAAFEKAEAVSDAVARRRWLTFVVVGGGPTGVEMAGSIAELARFALRGDFHHFDPGSARIILVEAGPRLLNGFADGLSEYTLKALRDLKVDVRLSSPIEDIDADGVRIGTERIAAGLVIWCAGVRGTPAAGWLGVPLTAQGLVSVEPDMSVAGHPEIFVIGDLAAVKNPTGRPLPQVAPVAKQQGAYVARVIRAHLRKAPSPKPFVYRNPGALAVIGRSAAVADFGAVRLKGLLAWLVWAFAHILFLIGFRNRSSVFLSWAWEWWTDRRAARLIIGRKAE